MVRFEINGRLAPKDWGAFQKWFKGLSLPDGITVEHAYKSLGYKIPVKKEREMDGDNKSTKKKK